MFSTGQLVFAVLFFIGFVGIIIYAYRADRYFHKKQYKGSWWILIAFIAFIAVLSGLKYLLRS